MIVGSLLAPIPIYMLFTPAPSTGIVQFLILVSMLYLAWTMIEIPYNAWGSELSDDYNQRTTIVTFRVVASSLGAMLFLASPLLPISASSEFDLPLMKTLGLVIAIALPLFVFLAVRVVPEPVSDPRDSLRQNVSFRELWMSVMSNAPFIRLIAAFSLTTIGSGIYNGLLYIFVDTFLGIGEFYSYLAIVIFVVTWIALPGWTWMLAKVGKHQGWLYGALVATAFTPLLAFVNTGESASIPLLVIAGLIALASGASMIAPYSIMADIIDFDEFRTGVNQASNYFAVMSLVTKTCAAVGAGLGLILVGFAGYQVDGENSDSVNQVFLVVMLGSPILFNLIMIGILWNFPLNQHRQSVIRRFLKRRAARISI